VGGTCPDPRDDLGKTIFIGKFQGVFNISASALFQDFRPTVPSSMSGDASIQVQRVSLTPSAVSLCYKLLNSVINSPLRHSWFLPSSIPASVSLSGLRDYRRSTFIPTAITQNVSAFSEEFTQMAGLLICTLVFRFSPSELTVCAATIVTNPKRRNGNLTVMF